MFATRPARRMLGTAGFAEHSSPHAVAFEQCLAKRRIVQLGNLVSKMRLLLNLRLLEQC